ncbi:MAG: C39 family peptidase [Treponema sp.]|jgi:hypothetical protein|nr:C39 family peptidase [Treponema sp.]
MIPLVTAMLAAVPAAGAEPAVRLDVPFFCQAPTANWGDPRQQDGCEEAAILMAHLWLGGSGVKTTMTAAGAEAEIIAISEWEKARYGFYEDRSLADTAALFEEYYGHKNWEIKENVTVAGIKAELAAGSLVIVPANGRLLANPYFSSPGPVTHMLVIVGYDEDDGVFLTNDPGTRRGQSFPYPCERLVAAIYDYPTGRRHVPYRKTAPVMLVIRPVRP